MEGYAPYLAMITANGVAETGYILSSEGAICATNLPITELPRYEFDLEQDDGSTTKIVVDERANLLATLANKGVPKHKEGIRLYNQKYVPVKFDEENKTLYLKKMKGGACIAVTNKLILIGTFNTEQKMSNGVHQNPGELNKQVEAAAKYLRDNGY